MEAERRADDAGHQIKIFNQQTNIFLYQIKQKVVIQNIEQNFYLSNRGKQLSVPLETTLEIILFKSPQRKSRIFIHSNCHQNIKHGPFTL